MPLLSDAENICRVFISVLAKLIAGLLELNFFLAMITATG